MPYKFNPFTSTFDYVSPPSGVTDPLVLNNLTVTSLLEANHIHGNIAGSLYIHVKNLDTVPLPKGTPFYISGTVGASDRVEIKAADNTDPSKGPAVGLVENTLAVNGEGNGVITGEIFQYDTATRGWQTNDPLYVTASGGLSNVQPPSGYRQIVGHVGRVHELTGTIIVVGTGIDPVAGSDTQIQFNDNGGFGASVDLTWDDTSKKLGIGGDINLDDGGTYSTTLQVITPTADRVISFPNATGTLALVSGASGQLIINRNGSYAGLAGSVVDTSNNVTLSSRLNISKSGSDFTSAATLIGTWPVNGTATTTKPQFLIEPAGTTSTSWSTSGTGLGVNAASGFNGNLLDLQVNGTSLASINSSGGVRATGSLTVSSHGIGLYHFNGDVFYLGKSDSRVWFFAGGTQSVTVGSTSTYAWASTSNPTSNFTTDLLLFRDAAGTLAQRNGTNAQTYRIYNTYTDASNYERAKLSWNSNVFEIGTEGAGTGSTRPVRITAATLKLPNLPTYADNTAALAGGLVAGDVYKTATGELRITI